MQLLDSVGVPPELRQARAHSIPGSDVLLFEEYVYIAGSLPSDRRRSVKSYTDRFTAWHQ